MITSPTVQKTTYAKPPNGKSPAGQQNSPQAILSMEINPNAVFTQTVQIKNASRWVELPEESKVQ